MDTSFTIDKNSFSEVYYYISQMHPENKQKISYKFIEYISENKNDSYIPYHLRANDISSFSKDARTILSIMFRLYFCSDEKRKALLDEDNMKLNEMYKVFAQEEKKVEFKLEENKLVETKKEDLFTRIIKKIKELLFNK